MPHLRSFLAVFVCGAFWTLLGLLLGALFRHPWLGFSGGLAFGLGYCLFGSWAAEKFPLDVWEARMLTQDQAPNAYEMLLELSEKTDTPQPTLYTCARPDTNAFVVAGREGSRAVVMSLGVTRRLERSEVQAILSLLMARLATGAMPGWTVTATLAGLPLYLGARLKAQPALAWLGSGLIAVFTPLGQALLQFGCDPGVVLAADVHAAHLAEEAGALPSALAKIEAARGPQVSEAGGMGTEGLFVVAPFGPSDVSARVARADAVSLAQEA